MLTIQCSTYCSVFIALSSCERRASLKATEETISLSHLVFKCFYVVVWFGLVLLVIILLSMYMGAMQLSNNYTNSLIIFMVVITPKVWIITLDSLLPPLPHSPKSSPVRFKKFDCHLAPGAICAPPATQETILTTRQVQWPCTKTSSSSYFYQPSQIRFRRKQTVDKAKKERLIGD